MDKIPLKPFFVVWRPAGGPPVKKQGYRSVAEHEALRIAKANPGSEVFIMAPITRVIFQDADRTEFTAPHAADCRCDECDDIPF